MRRIVGAIGTFAVGLAVVSGAALAQGTRAPADAKGAAATTKPKAAPRPAAEAPPIVVDPEKVRKLEGILKQWEKESATITQLDATFKRTDRKLGFKTLSQFEGRALLKSPNLACLNLEKVDAGPEAQVKTHFHERILCTGDDVVQYDGATKQIIIYPLGKGEQQRALQQGPLPFLFNMKAAEVKARYNMELMLEGRDAYRIKIAPKEEIDRDAFAEALLDLDRQTFLPRALMLTSPNEKETQTYVFKAIETEKKVDPANFKFQKIEGWKVVRNPDPNARPSKVGNPRAVGVPEDDPRDSAARPKAGSRPR